MVDPNYNTKQIDSLTPTVWLDPQSIKLEPHCIGKQIASHKNTTQYFTTHTEWFDPQSTKLEPHCIGKQIALHENTTQYLNLNSNEGALRH